MGRASKIIVVGFCLTLAGCGDGAKRYAAEVGYHRGNEIAWEIWGDFTSLVECRDAAIARYNYFASEQKAYSWSCLLKNDSGGYASRHR
jgi:hypothetical protein